MYCLEFLNQRHIQGKFWTETVVLKALPVCSSYILWGQVTLVGSECTSISTTRIAWVTNEMILQQTLSADKKTCLSTDILLLEFKPSAPKNLRAHAFGNYIRLDWDNPETHPGGVLYYRVHYRPQGTNNYITEPTTHHENTWRLNGMMPNTEYEIYATAKSSNYESGKSNTILVTTGGKFWRLK